MVFFNIICCAHHVGQAGAGEVCYGRGGRPGGRHQKGFVSAHK